MLDTRKALAELSAEDVNMLKKLEYCYIGRQGKEYMHPVIEPHFSGGKPISNITARGYIQPSVTRQLLHELPSMFDYVPAFQRFLAKLEENILYRHTWNQGDLVIFNNHRFLHGRESECVDTDRHLYRIWLSLHQL
jgi:alpha-ketoglutarate-dependent taurine dioxygenase